MPLCGQIDRLSDTHQNIIIVLELLKCQNKLMCLGLLLVSCDEVGILDIPAHLFPIVDNSESHSEKFTRDVWFLSIKEQ